MPGGPDPRLLPEGAERVVLPLLQQIALVGRGSSDRRAVAAPGHPREPVAQILGLDGRGDGRVGLRLGALQRVLVGPGRLFQFERPALPHAAREGVREATRVERHAGERRRSEAGRRHLRMRIVAQAHGPDLAVAPRLRRDPGDRVKPVLGLVEILRERAFGGVASTAILPDHHVALAHHPHGQIGARQRLGMRDRSLGAGGAGLVVGRPLQHDWTRGLHRAPSLGRQIDVGCQPDAVAHRHHYVPMHDDVPVRARRGGGRHSVELAACGSVSSDSPPSMVRPSLAAQCAFCQ